MGVDAITRTEKVRRDKLADAEKDLFRKEGRCLKCREPIFITKKYPNHLAVAKKTSTGGNHTRTCFLGNYPGRPPDPLNQELKSDLDASETRILT
jgi:hypothetical protein